MSGWSDFNPPRWWLERLYVLDGHEPVQMPDFERWNEWMMTHDRHVKWTEQGDVYVSTIFLGNNHRYFGDGPPILFETMAFKDGWRNQIRYATWDDAVKGHDEMVREVFAAAPIT